MGINIGYARTSTTDQVAGLEAQIARLRHAQCGKIFTEQVSSRGDRPELERLLDYVREGDGDTLVVCKLDRLARSVRDALDIVERLKTKGATLKVLDSPLDMTSPFGELLFSILAAIAQFERDLMLERQRDGIAKAKAEGKYRGGGHPTAVRKTPQVLELRKAGKSVPEIARTLSIGERSVARILADNKYRDRDLRAQINDDPSKPQGAVPGAVPSGELATAGPPK